VLANRRELFGTGVLGVATVLTDYLIWSYLPELPPYLVLAVTAVLWVLGYLLVIRKPSNVDTTYAPSEKGKGRRLLRFARRPKVSSRDFWQQVAYGWVVGAAMVYVGWAFGSQLQSGIPSQAILEEYAISGVIVVLGIFFLVLSGLRTFGELYAVLDKRATIQANRQGSRKKWLEDFKDEVYDFKNPRDKDAWRKAVTGLAIRLSQLETNQQQTWPDSIKTAVLGLLADISDGFTSGDVLYKSECAALLRLAYTKRDVFVNAEIVKRFEQTFEDLTDPELLLNVDVLLLRQEMHEFQEAFMTKLTDQAIHDWDNERFGKMWEHIRYDQLKQRDQPALERIKNHLRAIKQDKQTSQTVRDRASRLLDRAKMV
jgi:hypothetical protein